MTEEEQQKKPTDVISYSEALQPFIGNWAFDVKKSKDIPGTVSSERIMKKAKVPLTKRIGLQYFVGNDVNQVISVDEDDASVHIEAFVKGIPSWTKILYMDDRKVETKDALFGKAIASSFYDPQTKELHTILDSVKKENGRLVFIRDVDGDTMNMKIRWYPSSEDSSIFITHQRVYTRKGSQFSLGEILQKKKVKSKLSNSVTKPMGEINHLATNIGNRIRRNTTETLSNLKSSKEIESSPPPTCDSDSNPNNDSTDSLKSKSLPCTKELTKIPSSTSVNNVVAPTDLEPLWKSLVLPLSAFLLSVLVFVLCTKLS